MQATLALATWVRDHLSSHGICDLDGVMQELTQFGAFREGNDWFLPLIPCGASESRMQIPGISTSEMRRVIEVRGVGGWLKNEGCGRSIDALDLTFLLVEACGGDPAMPYFGRGPNFDSLCKQLDALVAGK